MSVIDRLLEEKPDVLYRTATENWLRFNSGGIT